MSDPDDVDHEMTVKDLVDDPARSYAHPIGVILTREFRAPGRSRSIGQQIDRGAHPLLLVTGHPSEGFDGASGDLDSVATQRRPRSALTSSQDT